jgi:cytochrome c peroxidase
MLGERAQAHHLSCASCHPGGLANPALFIEGASDAPGNVDLKSGFFRGTATAPAHPVNIPSLRGVGQTAPYGRDGRIGMLSAFIENVVTSEFAGKPLPLARLRSLTAYVQSLAFLPNRLIDERGRLTAAASPAARRGETLFGQPRAGLENRSCADCHRPGTQFTDRAIHARPGDGAGDPALTLKTPTLFGSAATAPYFHDGSLATVADVVGWYDRQYRLGLDPAAAEDLAAYVQAVGAVDALPEATPRDRLVAAARYLTLLESGEHAEERDLWGWTLTLVGDEIAALPADAGSRPALADASRETTALTAAIAAAGGELAALRPRVAAMREALTKLAVDWSFAAVLGR